MTINNGVTFSGATFNIRNVRAQMREAAQSNNRGGNLNFPAVLDDSTTLQPLTNEKRLQLAHAYRTDINARLDDMLNGRNYSSLSDSDISKLAWNAWEYLHTPVVGEAQRGLGEMASFLEQKLNEIDNDESLSPERRDMLRRIWQEGFVKAVRGTEFVQLDESAFRRGRPSQDAEADIRASMESANHIASTISSITNNPEIQNLILQGLEELVTLTILRSASSYYSFMRSQGESQANASNSVAAFRNNAAEMFSSLRAQWGNSSSPLSELTRDLFSRANIAMN
jgi:hypothetical protein